MLINIVSSIKDGGAELLVNELHKIYLKKKLLTHTIFFKGSLNSLEKNCTVLGSSSRSILNIFRVRKILKKFSSQSKSKLIIHSHLTWPFFYTVIATIGLKNIKLYYTEHNTFNRRRNIPLFWIVERFFYSKYSSIVCISKGTKKSLTKWVGLKISKKLITIHNGSRIFSCKKRTSIKNRLPRLISIGSLSKQKNFSVIINALAELEGIIESYTIVGDGPEKLKIKKIIESKNLKVKVVLAGWSNNVEKYLHEADIQVIPSLWEGFGLVAVEGMSTGLPIIASSVDGLTEVLGNSSDTVSYVKNPKSIKEWINMIKKATINLNTIGPKKIAKYSCSHAKKFSLNKMADMYIKLYKNDNLEFLNK